MGYCKKRLLSIAGLFNLLSPLKLFKTPRSNDVLPAFVQDCVQLLALVYVLDILVHLLPMKISEVPGGILWSSLFRKQRGAYEVKSFRHISLTSFL